MYFNIKNITDPQASVYVNASAGSGKTKLLIDRIVRMLLQNVDSSKILCITFTNAAAKEMENRLNDILLSYLTMPIEKLKIELYNLNGNEASTDIIRIARGLFAKIMLDPLKIQTLHSFSASLLQKMHLLNDNNTIIDNDNVSDLLYESFIEIIQDTLYANALKILLDEYSIEYIFDLIYEFWIRFSYTYDCNIHNDQYDDNIIYQFYNIKNNISIQSIINDYIITSQNNLTMLASTLSDEHNIIILKFLHEKSYLSFLKCINIFLTKEYSLRVRIPKTSIQDIFIQEQHKLYNIIQQIHAVFAVEFTLNFNRIKNATIQKFSYKKHTKHLLEYTDLINNAMNIISNDVISILYALDMSIEHLLIDEAQDLSEIQWSFIKMIADEFFDGIGTHTNNRTIFVVGDFKQSIFSFQGAAPHIFQNIKEHFNIKTRNANKIWHEIELNLCYRCAPEILQIVDIICNKFKTAFNIQNTIAHQSAAYEQNGIVKLHEVAINKDSDENICIAESITNMINEWFVKEKTYNNRVILPQDIMILCRKRSTLQEHIVNMLNKHNIAINNLITTEYSHSIYIYDLISVLQFILQPFDEMNLVALLKSYPFNYDDDQIIKLCQNRDENLWFKVKHIPLLQEILYNAKNMNLHVFFQWYLNTIYIQNKETLKFMDYILEYYSSVNILNVSLENFMYWLHNLMSKKTQEITNSVAITMTTIHSAKGLEAPIIILTDTLINTKFTRCAYHNNVLWFNFKNNNNIQNLINIYNHQLFMEDIRLLYVAITRAKKELHVFGCQNTSQNSYFTIIKDSISHLENHH